MLSLANALRVQPHGMERVLRSLLSREQPFVEAGRRCCPIGSWSPVAALGEQPFVEACTVVDCPRRSDWSLISPAQPFVEAQKVRGSDPFRRAQSLLS